MSLCGYVPSPRCHVLPVCSNITAVHICKRQIIPELELLMYPWSSSTAQEYIRVFGLQLFRCVLLTNSQEHKYGWERMAHLLNCLRKIPMFIARLESRMETWWKDIERERERWTGVGLKSQLSYELSTQQLQQTASRTHLLFGFSERAPGRVSPGARDLWFVVVTKQLLDGLNVDLVLLPHSALSPQVGPPLHLHILSLKVSSDSCWC